MSYSTLEKYNIQDYSKILGSNLVETSCHNTSTKLPFDIRQVPTEWQAQGPYINGDSTKFACSSGQNLKDCLSAVDNNYDKQGGWLGPYPTSDGFLKSNGKLAYYDSNGNVNIIDSTYTNGVTSSVSCDSGKCMYNLSGFDPANPNSSKKVSFDLQQECSTVSDCNRNPFYCPSTKTGQGGGTCSNGVCECDGSTVADGASCDPPPICKTSTGGSYAGLINVTTNKNKYNSDGQLKRWPLSTCTPTGGRCLGPDGKQIANGGVKWSKSGVLFGTAGSGNLGPLYQYGEDAPSAVANKDLNMDECGLCLPDDKSVGLAISDWNVNPKTCTNGSNFGCCSGTCYTKDEKYLVCGCRCDSDCPSGYICEDGGGSCIKDSKDCWPPRTAVSPLWGNNCCHYTWPGVMCADASSSC